MISVHMSGNAILVTQNNKQIHFDPNEREGHRRAGKGSPFPNNSATTSDKSFGSRTTSSPVIVLKLAFLQRVHAVG